MIAKNQIHLVQLLERLALHTWPAQTQQWLDGWLLRASDGITKRANSVWTSTGAMPADPEWFNQAASFYHAQGLPLRFHISDTTDPALIALLDEKGFQEEVPCSVMIAQADQMTALSHNIQPLCSVEIQEEHDETWLSNFMELEGHGNDPQKRIFYDRIFKEISPAKSFMTLYSSGEAVAVGTSVVEDGWAGFLNLVVHPSKRGQGIGKELVHQLAAWSAQQGAFGLYLQVVDDNEPACRLYRKAGFSPLYTYHYRIKRADD